MQIRKFLKAAVLAVAAGASLPTLALNIVVTNDDGCEASMIHALYRKLTAAGHQVIISASALDGSGQGGALAFLRPVVPLAGASRGGHLPAGTPGVATLAAVPTIDYGSRVFCVNSTPVASTLHGIDVAAAAVFGTPPDLVISGPNYGNNTGLINNGSGTVNAALVAVNRGFPAIATSAAAPLNYRAFDLLQASDPEFEHAELVVALVERLVRSARHGKRELIPAGNGLNVNFPDYATGTGGTLRWQMSDVGTGPSATPFFVSDLSTSTIAQRVGLGNVHLPGVSLLVAGVPDPSAAGLRFVDDTDPSSEQNVVDAGRIAVSVIQGNHEARRAAKLVVRTMLHGLVD